MARRTFQVIDVVEVLQHWHAGRPVVMSGRNDDGNEFGLLSRVVGGLPIVNHMLDRLGLPALIAGALPPEDARVKLAPAIRAGSPSQRGRRRRARRAGLMVASASGAAPPACRVLRSTAEG